MVCVYAGRSISIIARAPPPRSPGAAKNEFALTDVAGIPPPLPRVMLVILCVPPREVCGAAGRVTTTTSG